MRKRYILTAVFAFCSAISCFANIKTVEAYNKNENLKQIHTENLLNISNSIVDHNKFEEIDEEFIFVEDAISSDLQDKHDNELKIVGNFLQKEQIFRAGVGQYSLGYQGVIYGESFTCPFSATGHVSAAQKYIDTNYAGALLEWGGRIGVSNKGKIAGIIGSHNGFKPFGTLGGTKVGSIITIETSYGTFKYQVMDAKAVSHQRYVVDVTISGNYDLILYTCYPFNAAVTDQRYYLATNLVEANYYE